VLLALLERRNHDEYWNCEPERRVPDVISAAERARPTSVALSKIFGEHWSVVVCLAYRVHTAQGPELAELLKMALQRPERGTQDRDATISARWLVAQAMNHKPAATIQIRDKRRRQVGTLQNLATDVALNGYPEAETDRVYEWLTNVVPLLIPQPGSGPKR